MLEAIRYGHGIPHEVRQHILDTFGAVQDCMGCGVCAPPIGAKIEVTEEIQTIWGVRLDVIEPGIYKVGRIENGASSHHLELECEDGSTFSPCIGYSPAGGGVQIDWRGAKKAEEPEVVPA